MFGKILLFICLSVTLMLSVSYTQGLGPEMWHVKFQRQEVAPKSWIEKEVRYAGEATLAISGDTRKNNAGKVLNSGIYFLELHIGNDRSISSVIHIK